MELFDSLWQPVELGRDVGQGGEATVYQVVARPGLLAKIYNRPPPADYQEKLTWMQDNPPQNPTQSQGHASIAWPLDLVYSQQGQTVGYLMPWVRNAVSLLEVFNPRRRKQTLPGFNQKYLHRTARNLATALAALHRYGYIVGDMNESNVMVTPSALVTMIDTDSFQITVKQGRQPKIYPCPVGKPEYTAPELQGKSFRSTHRRPEHDCFGLAVLIFQLLMNGSHPFRARWLGPGDPPPLEDRIAAGCFPYRQKPPCLVAPPQNSPDWRTLHPGLQQLFQECFATGHQTPTRRPTADTWVKQLAQVEQTLIECQNGHYYAGHLDHCPYCIRRLSQTATLPVARPAVAAPPTRPIVATPITQPGSIPVLPAVQAKPAPPHDFLYHRWQLGILLLVVAILIYGFALLAFEFVETNRAATMPTDTSQPTFTPLPTTRLLDVIVQPTLLPTTTPPPSPTLTPLASPSPLPAATTTPTPTPMPTPTPLPTATPRLEDPKITIVLPGGNSYSRGDSIDVLLSFEDPNGLGNVFWWVTDAANDTVRLRQNHWCNNQVNCVVSENFTDLPPGAFNIFVSAFDTLQNGAVAETQIVVR